MTKKIDILNKKDFQTNITVNDNLNNQDDNLKDYFINSETEVDAGLVKLFINMMPEERLKANDNAVNLILEMRNAYKEYKRKNSI